MAHKGRVWPFAFQRDLSMSPNHLGRLPTWFTWTGLVCSGSQSIFLNGKILKLHQTNHSYGTPPHLVWRGEPDPAPPVGVALIMNYEVTGDVNLSKMDLLISTNFGTSCYLKCGFSNDSFPTMFEPVLDHESDPEQLHIVNGGIIRPTPWASIPSI